MNRTVLAIGIIFLLIGTSIVSSTDNKIKDIQVKYQSIKPFNNPKNRLACDHLAYIGGYDGVDWLYTFTLNDPENLTLICSSPHEWNAADMTDGAAWTNEGKIIFCDRDYGWLWIIYPELCELDLIGGGGVICNGLAWDSVHNKLYGTDGYDLYEYDPDWGNQDWIGHHSQSGDIIMVDIACDGDGILYGWACTLSSESYLYEIDTETGEASLIGSLGISPLYPWEGDFYLEDDILYIFATDSNHVYLYQCDEDTGSCNLVGQTQDFVCAELFAIPWNYPPNASSNPNPYNGEIDVDLDTDLSWTCSDPDGDNLTYDVYFGDNSEPPIVSSAQSTKIYDPGTMSLYTIYYWKIVAKDEHDAETESPIWSFTTRGNNPPNIPNITGPNSGKTGTTYNYTFTSIDPDGDDIAYYDIIWGDGKFLNMTGPFASGETVTASHKWKEEGSYTIKARATDVFGKTGYCGELTVTMPRDKEVTSNILLLSLLERFSLLQKLPQQPRFGLLNIIIIFYFFLDL